MVKFIFASDIHITNKAPKARLDDYVKSQYRKLSYLFKYSAEKGVDAILFAGDVFDTPFVPNKTIKSYIELINNTKDPSCLLCCIYGQHDLVYHSLANIENTPLAVLLAGTGGIQLGKTPVILKDEVALYGLSWDEPYPKIEGTDKLVNVLLAHLTVVADKELFPGQKNFVIAKRLLYNTPFDILVTGDNHQRFISEFNGKYLFNNGSIMRMNISQRDFRPSFTYVEVDNKSVKYELVYFPIKDNVFKETVLSKVGVLKTEADEDNDVVEDSASQIESFFENLAKSKEMKSFDFLSILKQSLEGADKDTAVWVNKIVDTYSENKSEVRG